MAFPPFRKIFLKGDARYDEAFANGVIYPGDLIELMTNAGSHATFGGKKGDVVKAAATENGGDQKLIAIEDQLQGKTTLEPYAAGDVVRYYRAQPGDEFAMRVVGEVNYVAGAALGSSGDGTLKPWASGPKIAVVSEDIDLSAVEETTLIPVRIL